MTAPLALTQGDPAGVGPEITISAWRALQVAGPAFFVVGDPSLYGPTAKVVESASDAFQIFSKALPVLARSLACPAVPGRPDVGNAAGVIASIDAGVDLCADGQAAALVTNPVAKDVLHAAGFESPGHTEHLARRTAGLAYDGARGPVMMLAAKDLKVALATVHEPLSAVSKVLTVERIAHVARVLADALRRDFGVAQPRIALCGLNPHAGEGGAFGREEIEIVNPAAAALRAEGIDISDARPADTLFHADARAGYDAVVAMYHDQGLIPIKTLDFHGAVNVTLGLPIVRTSPDHGTAFNIAGKGLARADSLIAALRLADAVARRRAAA